jgi:hypothetical protein
MAAFDYSATAQTAERLLARFGAPVIFKVKEPGIYNPATGKVEYGYLGERWSEDEVHAVVLQYDLADIDGTLIQVTDSRVLLAPTLSQEPKKGDVLVMPVLQGGQVVGYEEYEVINNRTIAPAGIPVLYEVQARKD